MSVAAELANCQLRIKELETRMRQLEAALAAMQQQHQAAPARRPPAVRPDAFILDDDLVALAAGGEPVQAEPPPLSATAARKQLSVTPPRAAAKSPTTPTQPSPDVDLSFTDAFSSLDDRLQEQLELETRAAPAVTAGHPVLIDPRLIDKAFAKPPPELIHVVSDLEEQYAHLAEKVLGIWGTPECVAFLRKLIVDERGGRQGFPFEVMSELLVLSAIAETPAIARAWESDANVAKKAAQAPG